MQIRLKQLAQEAAKNGQMILWDDVAGIWKPGMKSNSTNANPGVNDDITEGYGIGSVWVNTTTDNFFICVDNTDGAAIWVGVSGGSGEVKQEAHAGDVIAKGAADTVLSWGPVNAPISAASFRLFLNGVLQKQGVAAGCDYSITGATLQTITWLTTTGPACGMDASDVVTFVYETLGT